MLHSQVYGYDIWEYKYVPKLYCNVRAENKTGKFFLKSHAFNIENYNNWHHICYWLGMTEMAHSSHLKSSIQNVSYICEAFIS